MKILQQYGTPRFSTDGIGALYDENGQALSREGAFELAQIADGRIFLALRVIERLPAEPHRPAVFRGASLDHPPKMVECAGRIVRAAWGTHGGRERTDYVLICHSAAISSKLPLPQGRLHSGTAVLVNYFGHARELRIPGVNVTLDPIGDLRELSAVYQTGGGVFATHQARAEGAVEGNDVHGLFTAVELALSMEMGTRVDHFEVSAIDEDAASYSLLWAPSAMPRAAHPNSVWHAIDPNLLLQAMVRPQTDQSNRGHLELVEHYLLGCNFTSSALGRGLAAASLIDALRQCFESRYGVENFPLAKGLRRQVRATALEAGTTEIGKFGLAPAEGDNAVANLKSALAGFGRSTFYKWLIGVMENEDILETSEARGELARVVTEARNKLVHEGRYAELEGRGLTDGAQWEALVFLAAALLCRWFGYSDGFAELPDTLVTRGPSAAEEAQLPSEEPSPAAFGG